ncbi:MAG: UDP-N-acetylglucosamine 2-epimerase (non-hydrolyzing) [Gammaproteobacteria bacterium]|nr:UDP-N-acetylglucosamine 2-epimerase (non-hydrolyzing) [Gammaproteobacteria bacterium]
MKIVSVVGARPQFIKAGPVSRALTAAGAEEILVHTGQHYDDRMSRVFFEELDLRRPDVDLGVGSGSHGAQTARMLEGVEQTLDAEHPDVLLVYGDTNSTLAGALAAAKLHIPVAHVEAGLRSGRRDMPEEINRVLTDHVSDFLFCPTVTAVDHLAREGIHDGVHLVGDVMVDSLEMIRPRLRSDAAARIGVDGRYYVATLHRADNVDREDHLRAALEVLGAVPGPVVLPVHPRTAASIRRFRLQLPGNVQAIEPVGYVDMLSLVARAEAVLTDSGGLQKETVLLGTRCITLRGETEWPETLEGGWNSVVGLDAALVLEALSKPAPLGTVTGFGDGQAAERIAEILVS